MNDSAPSRGLMWSFWIPVASLIGIELYVGNFDGWGAWAAAPLFLVPLLLSVAIAGAGATRCFLEFRSGLPRPSSMVFTLIASLPIFWLLVRRYFV